jgi:hypothetical protein
MKAQTEGTERPRADRNTVATTAVRWLRLLADWWLVEASKLLTGRAGEWLFGDQQRQLVGLPEAGDGVDVQLVTRSGQIVRSLKIHRHNDPLTAASAALAMFDLGDRAMEIGIIMPERSIFERTIEVPREAVTRLESIIADEMIRRTPFRPEQVFMRMSISAHPSDRGKRLVRQRVIRRDLVAQQCRRLSLDQDSVRFIVTPQSFSAAEAINIVDRPGKAVRFGRGCSAFWRFLVCVWLPRILPSSGGGKTLFSTT